MTKIMVTGVNGFVGKHLTRELVEREYEVVGVGRDDIAHPLIENQLSNYYSCDLADPEDVEKIDLSGLDAVISLAGLARVGDSFRNAELYMNLNVKVLTLIAKRILEEKINARVIAISTGALYDSRQRMPLTETSDITDGGSPYVQSKGEMEKAAKDLRRQGLNCVIVRPFNHTGPEQENGFLLPDLYEKIRASRNTDRPLPVGNLATKRDYTDVRDVVRAYADLADAKSLKYDLYNVCSSRSISGKEILGWLQNAMGVNLNTRVDDALLRPNDPLEIYGSYERLNDDTGWRPAIPIDKTVQDFVESMSAKAI